MTDGDAGSETRLWGVLPSRRWYDTDRAASVDPEEVLDRLEGLDIRTWDAAGESTATHLGPAAEEFYEAFGLGEDADRIAAGDTDGVAIAAIQGLTRRLDEQRDRADGQERRIERQQAVIEEQREDLETLRERVESLQTEVARLRYEFYDRD